MPRMSVVLIAAATALSSAVVAANIARSGAVAPYQTSADFDLAFKAAGASPEVVKLDAEKLRQAGLKRIDLTR
jgi:2-methylcitrate dehydratase PrpD